MADRFQPFAELQQKETYLRLLADSLSNPFTLAVFGRMKTGKSSLINALVGKPLAITGVEEATATLNWICHGDPSSLETFEVYWKDGRVERIPISKLAEWSGKEPEVLDKVKNTSFLRMFSNAESLKRVQIVDTPGTGSVADEHEHIAREFLAPRAAEDSEEEAGKADALLYVFSGVGREGDEASLAEFRKTRLPGSDPYNSIGVLHKWDDMEADDLAKEAAKKAERLRKALSDVVCDVIPVSAPLAMVARHAPAEFLEGLLEMTTLAENRDSMNAWLKSEKRWNKDEARARARQAYPSSLLPWSSFVRVIRLLVERSCATIKQAQDACLDASGIVKLQAELDRRFYRRADIIKQRLTRIKAQTPIESGLLFLNKRIQQLATDNWSFSELENFVIAADRAWLIEADRMNLMEMDLAFCEKMDKSPSFVEARDHESIHRILTGNQGSRDGESVPKEVLQAMISRYQHELNAPTKRTRDHFQHLIRRLREQLAAE